MKIIARGNDTVFIEATEQEVVKIMGFYWANEPGCPAIRVGCDVPISDMYDAIRSIGQTSGIVHKAAEEIEGFAKRMRVLERVIAARESVK